VTTTTTHRKKEVDEVLRKKERELLAKLGFSGYRPFKRCFKDKLVYAVPFFKKELKLNKPFDILLDKHPNELTIRYREGSEQGVTFYCNKGVILLQTENKEKTGYDLISVRAVRGKPLKIIHQTSGSKYEVPREYIRIRKHIENRIPDGLEELAGLEGIASIHLEGAIRHAKQDLKDPVDQHSLLISYALVEK
jgi:hypothetical protein